MIGRHRSRSREGAGILRRARRLAVAVRHAPDRLLHPLRRYRLRNRLRKASVPASVLFVCHGNINRSAYAAAAFARALARRAVRGVCVRSAGFIGPGRPAAEMTREIAMRRGMDLEGHQSRLIEPAEVMEAELVVVMTPAQRTELRRRFGRSRAGVLVLGDLDPVPIVRRAIQDPYGHPREVYEDVCQRLDRCVQELTHVLTATVSPG